MRYYQALEAADQAADSTCFIGFMLDMIRTALSQGSELSRSTSGDSPVDSKGDQVSD